MSDRREIRERIGREQLVCEHDYFDALTILQQIGGE